MGCVCWWKVLRHVEVVIVRSPTPNYDVVVVKTIHYIIISNETFFDDFSETTRRN